MRPVVRFDKTREGYPDGHAIDNDGNLWVAMFMGGNVLKIDPRTGKIFEKLWNIFQYLYHL